MIDVVLDANAALDWFLPSEAGESYSTGLLKLAAIGQIQFHTPLHFDVEVCGQLVRHHRRKPDIHSKQWLDTALQTLDILPINTHAIGVNFKVLGDLAASYNLTVYDTPYFHLARMLEMPIATRDRGLISAAKAWNVEFWQPQD